MTNEECTTKIIELMATIASLQKVVLGLLDDFTDHLKEHLVKEHNTDASA